MAKKASKKMVTWVTVLATVAVLIIGIATAHGQGDAETTDDASYPGNGMGGMARGMGGMTGGMGPMMGNTDSNFLAEMQEMHEWCGGMMGWG